MFICPAGMSQMKKASMNAEVESFTVRNACLLMRVCRSAMVVTASITAAMRVYVMGNFCVIIRS